MGNHEQNDVEEQKGLIDKDPLRNEYGAVILRGQRVNTVEVENHIPEQMKRKLILDDIHDTIELAVPIFASMISLILMKTIDTALVGHVSSESLSAASLSDLWTMCTGVLIQGRVLAILCCQAIGAENPKLAGIYLQISYVVLSLVSIFVIFTWNKTEAIWQLFGQADEVVMDASYYSRILAFSIPGQVAFNQLSQFFLSQKIMKPQVVSSTAALFANLLFGIIFVHGVSMYGFKGFGFAASPIVTTFIVYFQAFLMWFIFWKKMQLHKSCWGGWNLKEITKERVKIYCNLYFPETLNLASDYWKMGIIGLISSQIGAEEVAVFNFSFRIVWMTLIFISSVAAASGINIGQRLGNNDPCGAKRTSFVGIGICLLLLTLMCSIIVTHIRVFGNIFTSDDALLDILNESKIPFVVTLFLTNLAVALERIPLSMGRTNVVFWSNFISTWFGQIPCVFIFTRYWRNDLTGLYTGMISGTLFLLLILSMIAYKSDWREYSIRAMERSEKKKRQ